MKQQNKRIEQLQHLPLISFGSVAPFSCKKDLALLQSAEAAEPLIDSGEKADLRALLGECAVFRTKR